VGSNAPDSRAVGYRNKIMKVNPLQRCVLLLCIGLLLPAAAIPQGVVLDDFESTASWKPIPSDGVTMNLGSAPGVHGKALALSFEFHGGSGYAIAQKQCTLDLPSNYTFSFILRGETPVNNFEFKLLDAAGDVYWMKKLNVMYPVRWTKQTIRKRQIAFAWGPAGGGEITHVDRIEFVVSAGTGGKGTVFIDDFRLDTLKDPSAPPLPILARASSSRKSTKPAFAIDSDSMTAWQSSGISTNEWWLADFQEEKEIGGLAIDWAGNASAAAYDVDLSDDMKEWANVYEVTTGGGERSYIAFPAAEARYLRLRFKKSSGTSYGIRNIALKGPEFSENPNNLFFAKAADSPPGYYPKYFQHKQSYWTLVGGSGETNNALINEEGAVEVEKGGFSIEPFLYTGNHLVTWNDVHLKQSLAGGYLPIPSVDWEYQGLVLRITAFAAGEAGTSSLILRYVIENHRADSARISLFLAIRPFQVIPPWQNLNSMGGAVPVNSITYDHATVTVNGNILILGQSTTSGFGAVEFDQGDITKYLAKGMLPPKQDARDHAGFASGALRSDDSIPGIPSGSQRTFLLAIPHRPDSTYLFTAVKDGSIEDAFLLKTRKFWEKKLNTIDFQLPPSADQIVNTFKSSLGYICINRHGPSIQPGSRTYDRSWIRDGALTSAALLETGNPSEVRDYLDWYAKYQYPGGKIPCVVDQRGADPVPENDSQGEFIYAVRQYFLFTHDTTWLRNKFQNVIKTVRYIQEQRRQRKDSVYINGTPEQRACYGLVPESISHEGYSAKPMHSYWDDFFVLQGLKDAAAIAGTLHEGEYEEEFRTERDDFRKCLYASMRMAMANHTIDYIPGCVELGDFDATSTAIGVNPIGEMNNIPRPELDNTFNRYYKFFSDRRDGKADWVNYTPYEARIIGAFVYLNQPERAYELLEYFLADRRPEAWNHWAEVVWRDPSIPKFIGDMPHTWVASDYIRSVRSMFVYEREYDSTLVVAAGVRPAWVADSAGMSVKNLPSYYGAISYSMKMNGRVLDIELSGNLLLPSGGMRVTSPAHKTIVSCTIDGAPVTILHPPEISVYRVPAHIVIHF
jgi:hypothetical protein